MFGSRDEGLGYRLQVIECKLDLVLKRSNIEYHDPVDPELSAELAAGNKIEAIKIIGPRLGWD